MSTGNPEFFSDYQSFFLAIFMASEEKHLYLRRKILLYHCPHMRVKIYNFPSPLLGKIFFVQKESRHLSATAFSL